MFDYSDDGEVQAKDDVASLNINVSQDEYLIHDRFDELQNAIDIYQDDHDVLTVAQNEIVQRIESKEREILKKQKELTFLIDQRDNGNRCLFRVEKNLHQLSRTLEKEKQLL